MTDDTSRKCGRPGGYFVDDAEMTVVESVEVIVVVALRRNAGTLILWRRHQVTSRGRLIQQSKEVNPATILSLRVAFDTFRIGRFGRFCLG
jgi:hypothetical protein